MASLLYTLEGWPSSPASDNIARSFGNDSLLWSTALATTPFTGQVASTSIGVRQKGGWDGSFWYVIGPDGKLYRFNPVANTWSAALVGGAVIITGTVEDQNWVMTSDGRFIYLLDSSSGFRRYDPVADTLTALAAIPGNSFSAKMLLTYDGSGTIFGFRGGTDATHQIAKYSIAGGTWTVLANNATISGDMTSNFPTWDAFLGGKWWFFYYISGANTGKVFQYDPAGDTWTAKSNLSAAISGAIFTFSSPFGEMTDSVVRVWMCSTSTATVDYDTASDTWSRGVNSPVAFAQGGGWAVNRSFVPAYIWLEADGVTPANLTENVGTLVVGETGFAHLKVKTVVARPSGATVSVPVQPGTDAEDVVTICQTSGGTFGTSFTTGALNPNDTFDVFVKVAPTAAQSAGVTKLFNLKVV